MHRDHNRLEPIIHFIPFHPNYTNDINPGFNMPYAKIVFVTLLLPFQTTAPSLVTQASWITHLIHSYSDYELAITVNAAKPASLTFPVITRGFSWHQIW